ncbi:MAG: SO_0444 family Cu/Zn efflux transporter [Planctomycetota bacterium]
MTGFFGAWLYAVWEILALSGPWLLVGFVLAGFLRIALPAKLVYRHLGKDNWRSVLTAAVAGVPIPLCSCSVLPTAMSLRKSGASKGATASFLISTPETGVDSIGVTWALMDPLMTVVRPVAALVTALGSGLLVNVLVKTGLAPDPPAEEGEALAAKAHDHGHDHGHDHDHDHDHDQSHGHSHSHDHPEEERGSVPLRALRYAFGPLLDDLTPWFVFGLALSGLIAVLVPEGFFTTAASSGWIAMLAMLAIGVPIYVCATASTPIAAALVAKGLDPGAALVFLLAGPATNLATIAVVRGFLGGRVLLAYLASIALFSLGCGALLGPIYELVGLDASARVAGAADAGLGPLDVAGGVLVLGLLLNSARRLGLHRSWGRGLSRLLGRVGIDTSSRVTRLAGFAAVVLAYLSTGVDVVRVGETGFLTRFGRVVRTQHEPGLLPHLPYPFERFESVRTDEIRGVEVGFSDEGEERAAFGSARRATRVTEVTTGDETLLQIPYAVHYTVADAYRHRFGVADSVELIVALSSTALQRAASRRTTSAILIDERRALELDVARMLEDELSSVQAGLEVVAVRIGSIHAPAAVHDAFRDVASALEDKERLEHEAEAYRVSALTEARGTAALVLETARARASAETKESQGRAEAFEAFLGAYRADPGSTLLRLQLDSLPRSLKGARVVFQLGDEVEVVNMPPFAMDEDQ